MKIIALIPAAGHSSRMGSFKPLLPLGRSTVIQEAVERFRRAGIDDIRVVIGHRKEELAPILDRLEVRKIFNPDYASGMLSSVLAGLRSLESEILAFFWLPVDVPLVKPSTINALVKAYRDSGAGILYPRFEGLRGHPPLISSAIVTNLPDDCRGGLRAFLHAHEKQALDLDVIDQSILMDCDTNEDYRKLHDYSLREDIPTERECEALLRHNGTPEETIVHSRMVAEIARMLAVHLKCTAGLPLNIDLVTSSGLLHDLCKGKPGHAGPAEILEEIGYGQVARIVALHTDIQLKGHCTDEAALVHLADKFVKGDLVVSLEDRFDGPLRKFAERPDILKAVKRRLRVAKALKKRVENILGVPVETVIRKNEKTLRMASKGQRRIFLVRHGAIGNQGENKCYIGHLDLPLNADGIRQGEALGRKLLHADITVIYCSDLQRSVATAKTIGKYHEIEPCRTPSFREVSLGKWEGLQFDEVRRLYPEEYEQRGLDIVNFRPPGGESFLECSYRVIPALYEALRSTRGDIVIVGHAGVNRILLCRVLGKSMARLFDIGQDYGCLNLIRYRNFAFELEILNDTGSISL